MAEEATVDPDSSGGATLGLADRVELGLPHGYWEENLALGRSAAIERMVELMAPLAGRRVLDPSCGWGSVARRMCEAGGKVVACAATARLCARARRRGRDAADRGARFVVAAEPFGAFVRGTFDDVVWIEPAELLDEARRERSLEQLDRLEARRVCLLLRQPTRWSALSAGAERETLPVLDFTETLREIHLQTRYRLERTAELDRRNSALRLALLRAAD